MPVAPAPAVPAAAAADSARPVVPSALPPCFPNPTPASHMARYPRRACSRATELKPNVDAPAPAPLSPFPSLPPPRTHPRGRRRFHLHRPSPLPSFPRALAPKSAHSAPPPFLLRSTPSFAYVNVVLFTEKPVPLLLPYVFDKLRQPENALTEWLFVNKKGDRARHRVDGLREVGTDDVGDGVEPGLAEGDGGHSDGSSDGAA